MKPQHCRICRTAQPPKPQLPACPTCYDEIATTLRALPALLAGLHAVTGRTLARPARETGPARTGPHPSSPAREDVIDLHAELRATVTDWAACVDPWLTTPPLRTLTNHLDAALTAPTGTDLAGRLVYLADVARRRLNPPEVIRVRDRCPACRTRGLVRYDTGGPSWCTYCCAEAVPTRLSSCVTYL